ncbi:MAG: hypothetical protein ABEJ65_04265, partial [bacterium]
LNGRNTKLSDVDQTASRLEGMLQALEGDDHVLTFSCSLDYLPRDRAIRKLNRLTEIREAVGATVV